jgi:methyl-accepting chemotaxis protein
VPGIGRNLVSSQSAEGRTMFKPIISSDSHVCEPPDVFVDRIDRKYLADAPRVVHDPERGDVYQIKGIRKPIPLSLIAAMIAQVIVVTMFFGDIKRDVELLKAKTESIENRYDADKLTLRDNLSILRDQFKSMDQKLDRLIERGKP